MRNVFIFCFIALFASIVFAQDIETQPRFYDLGKGYSAQIIPAEFKTTKEVIKIGKFTRFIRTPAKYEWVKGDGAEQDVIAEFYTEIVEKPPTYMTITQPVVTRPEHFSFTASGAQLDDNGKIVTPATFEQIRIPPTVKQVTKEVIKTPGRSIASKVPVTPREGYSFVMISPAKIEGQQMPEPAQYTLLKPVQKNPTRIRVINSAGIHVGEFDNLDDLYVFLETNGLAE